MNYRVLPLLLMAVALVLFVSVPVLADQPKERAADQSRNTHEGVAVRVSGNQLVMSDQAGKQQHTHMLAADARVTCDGKDCTLADIKPGMRIRVTTKQD